MKKWELKQEAKINSIKSEIELWENRANIYSENEKERYRKYDEIRQESIKQIENIFENINTMCSVKVDLEFHFLNEIDQDRKITYYFDPKEEFCKFGYKFSITKTKNNIIRWNQSTGRGNWDERVLEYIETVKKTIEFCIKDEICMELLLKKEQEANKLYIELDEKNKKDMNGNFSLNNINTAISKLKNDLKKAELNDLKPGTFLYYKRGDEYIKIEILKCLKYQISVKKLDNDYNFKIIHDYTKLFNEIPENDGENK